MENVNFALVMYSLIVDGERINWNSKLPVCTRVFQSSSMQNRIFCRETMNRWLDRELFIWLECTEYYGYWVCSLKVDAHTWRYFDSSCFHEFQCLKYPVSGTKIISQKCLFPLNILSVENISKRLFLFLLQCYYFHCFLQSLWLVHIF